MVFENTIDQRLGNTKVCVAELSQSVGEVEQAVLGCLLKHAEGADDTKVLAQGRVARIPIVAKQQVGVQRLCQSNSLLLALTQRS